MKAVKKRSRCMMCWVSSVRLLGTASLDRMTTGLLLDRKGWSEWNWWDNVCNNTGQGAFLKHSCVCTSLYEGIKFLEVWMFLSLSVIRTSWLQSSSTSTNYQFSLFLCNKLEILDLQTSQKEFCVCSQNTIPTGYCEQQEETLCWTCTGQLTE